MYVQLYRPSLCRSNLGATYYMYEHYKVMLAPFQRTWCLLHEVRAITPKKVWVKNNYMNTYIVGAFDGLIRENGLKMHRMSSSKTVCH